MREKNLENLPPITIVTPSLNQGDLIEETIRSVLDQNYPSLQYILIDGGSSDQTVEVVKRYERQIDYWESVPDNGQSHAINKGFQRATGDILGWLNSDDVLERGALASVAKAYRETPDAVAWVGNADVTDREGRFVHHHTAVVGGKRSLAKWGTDAVFFQPSCFFSRAAFERVGGLREDLHYAIDPDLWMRLSDVGRFVCINQTLSRPRIYAECKSHGGREKLRAELIACCVDSGLLDIAEFHLNSLAEEARQQGVAQTEQRFLISRIRRGGARMVQPARILFQSIRARFTQ